MKKILGIIVLILIIILIGGIYISKNSKNESMLKEANTEKDVMMEKESESMIKEEDVEKDSMMETDDATIKAGSYQAYGPEKLALADSGNVVLFFRASWCPTCRGLDADIKANINSIPSDLTILDVNYDKSTTLKQKYGVTYQHTLVQVDSSGNQITKWMGSQTLASLITNIK